MTAVLMNFRHASALSLVVIACTDATSPAANTSDASASSGATQTSQARTESQTHVSPGTESDRELPDGAMVVETESETDLPRAPDGAILPTSSSSDSTPAVSDSGVPVPSGECGNRQVGSFEQCDDGNVAAGDGCSPACRLEVGFKCTGEPSLCVRTVCGDGIVEGAETCDDSNAWPYDGCSSLCTNEPECSGASCTSRCGDGLVIEEACDDGNTTDGDGCSATCTVELGYECQSDAPCETVGGACSILVFAKHRDFADSDPDFGIDEDDNSCGIPEDDPIQTGIANSILDAEGLPTLGNARVDACIEDVTSFARWFRDGTTRIGSLRLFDNGKGGYVNRFHDDGQQFVFVAETSSEQQVGGARSLEECPAGCEQRTRSAIQCENVCRLQQDAVDTAASQLTQLETERSELAALLAEANGEPVVLDGGGDVATLVAELTTDIAELEARIVTLTQTATSCNATCDAEFSTQVNACVADCKPCSYNPGQWCTGGEYVYKDGDPLYFPVDDVSGPTQQLSPARISAEYGYPGWPLESEIFADAPDHNFSFTSEIRYWFRYDANSSITLDFLSDDDAFVFVNKRLAVDLGGLHVPMNDAVTINAESAVTYGLEVGKVYEIAVFKAERKLGGSAFMLTVPPFQTGPSVCASTR